ncbi:fungal-specific transcription factor domain-containing protein [Lipomyces orientalis]|uniref:Fungal-specific transcription factor domain-containing protein n=1 Tax=Lipomyces orientalis TaxID=1233043 RepID=A0ACC3TIK3_9ASCO
MSEQTPPDSDGSSEPKVMHSDGPTYREQNEQPKSQQNMPLSKRIACVTCRKKKLRCDGARPACGNCARMSQQRCFYEEKRRKSGPRRGYVKMLEQRLGTICERYGEMVAYVEGQLRANSSGQIPSPPSTAATSSGQVDPSWPASSHGAHSMFPFNAENPLVGAPQGHLSAQQTALPSQFGAINLENDVGLGNLSPTTPLGASENIFDLTALGMDERLPPQAMMNDLNAIFFETQHDFNPMIHKRRYMASLNYPAEFQPPIYLRYAVWAIAASASPKYRQYANVFYTRARKYLEQLQMRSHGENIMNITYTQAWIFVSQFEFKMLLLPRAWISAGIACRSAIMLQLNIVDIKVSGISQLLPPPSEWIETEERRRTFWCAFAMDRYSSIGTGWPLIIDENNIATDLPASETAFESGVEEPTVSLAAALNPTSANSDVKLSEFSGFVLAIVMFGRCHMHLHFGVSTTGVFGTALPDFFERFRYLDNALDNIMRSLSLDITRPIGTLSPQGARLIMSIHASSICLHQATVFRTRTSPAHQSEFVASQQRCLQAASEITKIMQDCAHFDVTAFDACTSFCVYIAARCFVQALRTSTNAIDPDKRARLDFLLTALDNMKLDIPIAQSFLLQLEVDLATFLDEESGVQQSGSGPSPVATPADSGTLQSKLAQIMSPGRAGRAISGSDLTNNMEESDDAQPLPQTLPNHAETVGIGYGDGPHLALMHQGVLERIRRDKGHRLE